MKNNALLVVALVLIAVGFVGLLGLEAVAPLGITYRESLGGAGRSAASGQRIYQTGLDSQGVSIPRTTIPVSAGALMMGGGGCASCHGANGHGSVVTMMRGYIEAPDITYTTLTNEGYTQAMINRAIRYGIDEHSRPMNALMPRWQMTDAELTDTIAYLKELSGQ